MGSFEGRKDKGETRQLYYNLKTKTKTHCSLPLLIPSTSKHKMKKKSTLDSFLGSLSRRDAVLAVENEHEGYIACNIVASQCHTTSEYIYIPLQHKN